jgi:glycosyltransferase involved in cell wall biosynthesis
LHSKKITAIIPALNEEGSVGLVLDDLMPYVDRAIVCDNGSSDETAHVAREHRAKVVTETKKGYGAACLRAVSYVENDTDILLFLDADYSDFPQDAPSILRPVAVGECDLVIGSRMLTRRKHNALTPVAAFGNWLSTNIIRLLWGKRFTDLGPFRAISFDAYKSLCMRDPNFGWTVEMQVKAAKRKLRCREVPVSYRPRIGISKVSGTISGSVKAGVKILCIMFKEAITA